MGLTLWSPQDDAGSIRGTAGSLEQLGARLNGGRAAIQRVAGDLSGTWTGDAGELAGRQVDTALGHLGPFLQAFSFKPVSAVTVLGDYALLLDTAQAEVDKQLRLHEDAVLNREESVRMANRTDPVTREQVIRAADGQLADAERRIVSENDIARQAFYGDLGTVVGDLSYFVTAMKAAWTTPYDDQTEDQGFGVQPDAIRAMAKRLGDAADRIEGDADDGLRGLAGPKESTLPAVFADLVGGASARLRTCVQSLRATRTGMINAAAGYEAGDRTAVDAMHQPAK